MPEVAPFMEVRLLAVGVADHALISDDGGEA
jgi:hypothetical protein